MLPLTPDLGRRAAPVPISGITPEVDGRRRVDGEKAGYDAWSTRLRALSHRRPARPPSLDMGSARGVPPPNEEPWAAPWQC